MRLINVNSLKLEEFIGNAIPQYAILSHTWGKDEVTFEDWKNIRLACRKSGFRKIKGACQRAKVDGIGWLWVDTNCIDKSSSAELSEAINSMFAWYRDAAVCYVYLEDVGSPLETQDHKARWTTGRLIELMGKSRWFTRGWTLQELLAPEECVFFNNDWSIISRKTLRRCRAALHSITGVEPQFLADKCEEVEADPDWRYDSDKSYDQREASAVGDGHREQGGGGEGDLCSVEEDEDFTDYDHQHVVRMKKHRIHSAGIAKRMSWMGRRVTTRVEDIAYCMLGIFDINMPLLYGEGGKAFLRLQEEIIKVSNDHTIFFWEWRDKTLQDWPSILAPAPIFFRNCQRIHPALETINTTFRSPEATAGRTISMTNVGLSIRLPTAHTAKGAFVALNVCDCGGSITDCRRRTLDERRRVFFLYLVREGDKYFRVGVPPLPIKGDTWPELRQAALYVCARPSDSPAHLDIRMLRAVTQFPTDITSLAITFADRNFVDTDEEEPLFRRAQITDTITFGSHFSFGLGIHFTGADKGWDFGLLVARPVGRPLIRVLFGRKEYAIPMAQLANIKMGQIRGCYWHCEILPARWSCQDPAVRLKALDEFYERRYTSLHLTNQRHNVSVTISSLDTSASVREPGRPVPYESKIYLAVLDLDAASGGKARSDSSQVLPRIFEDLDETGPENYKGG
jgi:hypothetical protein